MYSPDGRGSEYQIPTAGKSAYITERTWQVVDSLLKVAAAAPNHLAVPLKHGPSVAIPFIFQNEPFFWYEISCLLNGGY